MDCKMDSKGQKTLRTDLTQKKTRLEGSELGPQIMN